MINGKLQLGLVGLGTWARNGHLPVYFGPKMKPILKVTALCSRNRDKASKWSKEFGVEKFYDNFDEMIAKESLDVVAICTPDSHHSHYVLTALKNNTHVIVEKPLATSTKECSNILGRAHKVNKKVILLFHKRHDPLWREARHRVLLGKYGPLQMGFATIQNPIYVPAGDYFQSNMAMLTDSNWFLGTHFYDLLGYITGLNATAVRAHKYFGKLASIGYDVADCMKADFLFENNASISICSGWNLPTDKPTLTKQAITLHFQDGELELDGTRRGFTEHSQNGYSYVNPYFMGNTLAGLQGYGAQFLEEAVLSLCDTNYVTSVEMPTGEEMWRASAMAEAAEQSAISGDLVEISPPPPISL